MHKPVTTVDIAKYAGVSQSTVSRVLNRHHGVDAEKRKKVFAAMDALGFDRLALLQKQPVLVAVCPLPEQNSVIMSLDFFSTQTQAIQETLAARGMKSVRVTLPAAAQSLDCTEINYGLSGIILVNTPSLQLVEECKKTGIPFLVNSGKMPPYEFQCNTVGPDEECTAWSACNYLLAHTRRIGFLFAQSGVTRVNHLIEELVRRGVPVAAADRHFVRDTNSAAFVEWTYRVLKNGSLPEALVVDSYGSALNIQMALMFHQIEVKRDILLLTFSHSRDQLQLPSMCLDPRQLGIKAARRLLEMLADPDDIVQNIRIPMTLQGV